MSTNNHVSTPSPTCLCTLYTCNICDTTKSYSHNPNRDITTPPIISPSASHGTVPAPSAPSVVGNPPSRPWKMLVPTDFLLHRHKHTNTQKLGRCGRRSNFAGRHVRSKTVQRGDSAWQQKQKLRHNREHASGSKPKPLVHPANVVHQRRHWTRSPCGVLPTYTGYTNVAVTPNPAPMPRVAPRIDCGMPAHFRYAVIRMPKLNTVKYLIRATRETQHAAR